jgi:hypothetical protein
MAAADGRELGVVQSRVGRTGPPGASSMAPPARAPVPARTLVLAPTWLEWRAVRGALSAAGPHGVELVRCGVRLSRFREAPRPLAALVTCGLVGGLDPSLEAGRVVVASSVAVEEGEPVDCDPELVHALVAGARRCGAEPVVGPVLTASRMLVGPARAAWAARGFVAVEMETALLAPLGAPLATLRVVLDSARSELSDGWERPILPLLDPRRWKEAAWLAGRAPRYAAMAARCLAAALSGRGG